MNPIYSSYIDFYQSLTPARVTELRQLVTPDVYFRDPFNEVHSVSEYEHILSDMFSRCEDPSFVVERSVADSEGAFLRWRFEFGSPEARRRIVGCSELEFASDGRIASHIDYWDTSSQLFESVPILGFVLRRIRQSLSAKNKRG